LAFSSAFALAFLLAFSLAFSLALFLVVVKKNKEQMKGQNNQLDILQDTIGHPVNESHRFDGSKVGTNVLFTPTKIQE
jgi:hypothetical protein